MPLIFTEGVVPLYAIHQIVWIILFWEMVAALFVVMVHHIAVSNSQ